MKSYLAFLSFILISQSGLADMIAINCKNTKIPNMSSIEVGNTEDFSKSGSTAKNGPWTLIINKKVVRDAYVDAIGGEYSVESFKITLADKSSLFFKIARGEKMFVFLVSPSGEQVPDTISYCSYDID